MKHHAHKVNKLTFGFSTDFFRSYTKQTGAKCIMSVADVYRMTCQFADSDTEPVCSVYNVSIQADLSLSLSLVKLCTGWHMSSPSQTLNQPALFIMDLSRQIYHCHWLSCGQDDLSVHQITH